MEQIIKANRIYCFKSEYNKTDDLERKKKLSALIQKLSETKSSQTNLEKFNQMLNKIEVSQTKKPFHRLNEFQKEKLVKAYVIEKFGENDLYVKELMKMILNKDIPSADIKYNMDEFKLETIKNIEVINNKIILKPKNISSKKEKLDDKEVKKEKVKKEKVKKVKIEKEKVKKVKVEKEKEDDNDDDKEKVNKEKEDDKEVKKEKIKKEKIPVKKKVSKK